MTERTRVRITAFESTSDNHRFPLGETMIRSLAAVGVIAATLIFAGRAGAQPLGTFRWQLQPFCNVVTVNLIQQGAVFTMDGVDDQCGAAQRAPVVGLATPNADGSITVGLTIVTAPGGRGLQVAARVTLPSVNGTWSDSAGNGGVFAFNASSGGSPRPSSSLPGSAIAPGTITSTQLAAGIFAGSGGATTEARSDHLHDDRYYTKAQSDLTVDGVPVRGSAAYVPGSTLEYTGFLSGATVGVVAAGSHTISVGSQCVLGSPTGSGGVTVSSSSVVVLP